MNTAIIMLGSNFKADKNLELAKQILASHFEIVNESSCHITKPIGEHYKNNFHNIAIKLLSEETAEETKGIFKQIEKEMGRTPESKIKGLIPIDIDFIFWNQKLIHQDYNKFEHVKLCINEIIDYSI